MWRPVVSYVLLPSIAALSFACATPQDQMDKVRTANRSKLIHLQIGMDRSTVLDTMGTAPVQVRDAWAVVQTVNNPFRTEMFKVGDDALEILYYYTDAKQMDSAVTDDELTPLVLRNGKLEGWGWPLLKTVAAKAEGNSQ